MDNYSSQKTFTSYSMVKSWYFAHLSSGSYKAILFILFGILCTVHFLVSLTLLLLEFVFCSKSYMVAPRLPCIVFMVSLTHACAVSGWYIHSSCAWSQGSNCIILNMHSWWVATTTIFYVQISILRTINQNCKLSTQPFHLVWSLAGRAFIGLSHGLCFLLVHQPLPR